MRRQRPEPVLSEAAERHLPVLRPFNRAWLAEPRAYASRHRSLMVRLMSFKLAPPATEFAALVDELGELLNAIEPHDADHRVELVEVARWLRLAVGAAEDVLAGEESER